jgi:hypothetical protein
MADPNSGAYVDLPNQHKPAREPDSFHTMPDQIRSLPLQKGWKVHQHPSQLNSLEHEQSFHTHVRLTNGAVTIKEVAASLKYTTLLADTGITPSIFLL